MTVLIANINNEIQLAEDEYLLLPDSKKRKFDKISEDKRAESLLGQALVRKYLTENGFTQRLSFRKTAKGKPFTVPHCVEFSISHSNGTVAAALSDKKVGIDIELMREIDLRLSERVFTESENGWIFSASEHRENLRRFFTLWTLKEAYMKVTGLGMLIPFKSIEFRLSDDYEIEQHIKGYSFTTEFDGDIILSTAEKRSVI